MRETSKFRSPEYVQKLIAVECDDLKALLIEKNKAYGNSALDPLRIASKASPVEQILVRIDDKLSRLGRGAAAGEDVWKDLNGYIVLLRVAKHLEVLDQTESLVLKAKEAVTTRRTSSRKPNSSHKHRSR